MERIAEKQEQVTFQSAGRAGGERREGSRDRGVGQEPALQSGARRGARGAGAAVGGRAQANGEEIAGKNKTEKPRWIHANCSHQHGYSLLSRELSNRLRS